MTRVGSVLWAPDERRNHASKTRGRDYSNIPPLCPLYPLSLSLPARLSPSLQPGPRVFFLFFIFVHAGRRSL